MSKTVDLDVVGLGMCTVDVLVRTDTLPTWDRTWPFERIALDSGGPAATAVAAAARLGLRGGYIGIAGDDEFGRRKVQSLAAFGVDTSRMIVRDGDEPHVVICLVRASDGERVFWGRSGWGRKEAEIRTEELDKDYVQSARYLHLDGFHHAAAVQAARWMREAGGTVVLDGHQGRHVSNGIRELVTLSNVVIGGSGFLNALTGEDDVLEAGHAALALGPSIVVQTEGEKGSHAFSGNQYVHTPAFSVDVIDTTGAGDVFHGAFTVGISRGWDLRTILCFASAVAAIVCTHMGGRNGIPTFEETACFLHERGIALPGVR